MRSKLALAAVLALLTAVPAAAGGVRGNGKMRGSTAVYEDLKRFDLWQAYDVYDTGHAGPQISVQDLLPNFAMKPEGIFHWSNTFSIPGMGHYQEYRNVLPIYRAAFPTTFHASVPDRMDVMARKIIGSSNYGYVSCPTGPPNVCDDWDGSLNGITGDGQGGFDGFDLDSWSMKVPRTHWDAVVDRAWNGHDFCDDYSAPADPFTVVAAGSTVSNVVLTATNFSTLTADQYAGWTLRLGSNPPGSGETRVARVIATHEACTGSGTCAFTFANGDVDAAHIVEGTAAEVRTHDLGVMKTEACALLDASWGPQLYGFSTLGGNALGLSGIAIDMCNEDYQDWWVEKALAVIPEYGIGLTTPFSYRVGGKPGMWEFYDGPPHPTQTCNLSYLDGDKTWTGRFESRLSENGVTATPICSAGGRVFNSQYAPGDFSRCYSQMLRKVIAALDAAGYTDFKVGVVEDLEYRDKPQTLVDNDIKRSPHWDGHRYSYVLYEPFTYGYGAATTGGEGGSSVVVTNLNDSGAGSLRAAIDGGGDRIITASVSGVISLANPLIMDSANVTLDLGSAPSPGIVLTSATDDFEPLLRVRADNIIVRNVRFRPETDAVAGDGLTIGDGTNILIDHVSCSWASDECISINGSVPDQVRNVTIQNSLIGEVFFCPTAQEPCNSVYGHAFGSLVGGDACDVTFWRNVFVNTTSRSPYVNPGTGGVTNSNCRFEVVDNVIHSFMLATGVGSSSATLDVKLDVIGNEYTASGETDTDHPTTERTAVHHYDAGDVSIGPVLVYLDENYSPTRDEPTDPECDVFTNYITSGDGPLTCHEWDLFDSATRFAPHALSTLLPSSVVLSNAGATLPCRDTVDGSLVADATALTGIMVDDASEVVVTAPSCQ